MLENSQFLSRVPFLGRVTRRSGRGEGHEVPHMFYRDVFIKLGNERLFRRPTEGESCDRTFAESYTKYFNGGSLKGAKAHFALLEMLPDCTVLAGILEQERILTTFQRDQTIYVLEENVHDPYGRPLSGHVALIRSIPQDPPQLSSV